MHKGLITILLLMAPLLSVFGVELDSCQTTVLKEIFQHLNARGGAGCIVKTSMLGNREVQVRRNRFGIVTHIGTPLFAEDMRRYIPNQLSDFVERYLLQLSLLSPADRNRQFFDDLTHLTPDNPRFIDSLCQVQIESNEKKYTFIWTSPKGDVAKLTFPKSFELITGQNMSERDEAFRGFLMGLDSIPSYMPQSVTEESLEKNDSMDYYIHRGPYYIIKPMKSDTYYVKDSIDGFVPLVDEHYPEETLRNIFCRAVEANIQLQLNQFVYGLKKERISVSLGSFDYFCRETNCKPYVGIEDITPEGVIKATVLYENVDLDYNHLLYIEIDSNSLTERKGVANGFIMSYIPTHSLSNLYYENERKNRKR